MHEHTNEAVNFTQLLMWIEVLLFWVGVAYYGFRMITPTWTRKINGWADVLSEFGHFSCPLVMLPMTSLAWMGDETVIRVCAWFCLLMAVVFFGAWFFTHVVPILKELRWYMQWWWDLPHSLMFLVMYWTYQKHLGPLSRWETWALNLCVVGCLYFTARYANNVRKDLRKYSGMKLFYELMADFVHVTIFGFCAGMAWWPKYFMA